MRTLLALAILCLGSFAYAGEIFVKSDEKLPERQQKFVDTIKAKEGVVRTELYTFDPNKVTGDLTFKLPGVDKEILVKNYIVMTVRDDDEISTALTWRTEDNNFGHLTATEEGLKGMITYNKKLYGVVTVGFKKTGPIVLITEVDPSKIKDAHNKIED